MRKSRARWRQCILFCIVIISIFLIWSFLCRHADGMVESMGQNLSIKFYNGVLNLYAPAFIESQKEEAWLTLGREVKERGLTPAGLPRVLGIVAPYTGREIEARRYCSRIVLPVSD